MADSFARGAATRLMFLSISMAQFYRRCVDVRRGQRAQIHANSLKWAQFVHLSDWLDVETLK